MNLQRLIHTPNINPTHVYEALQEVFFQVISQPRNEVFFNFQFLCTDGAKARLVVRYGYSTTKNCWVFETLSPKGVNKC